MARQKLKALDTEAALLLGAQYWHPRKPAPKLLFADIDLGYLQNIVRWLKKQLELSEANENAAWAYPDSDSMASMYAAQAADDLSRNNYYRRGHIELLMRYILWREENGHIFHAPRAPAQQPRVESRQPKRARRRSLRSIHPLLS